MKLTNWTYLISTRSRILNRGGGVTSTGFFPRGLFPWEFFSYLKLGVFFPWGYPRLQFAILGIISFLRCVNFAHISTQFVFELTAFSAFWVQFDIISTHFDWKFTHKRITYSTFSTWIYPTVNLFDKSVHTCSSDSYQNLTLKMLTAFTWVDRLCPDVMFVIKADDDSYINIDIVEAILSQVDQKQSYGGRCQKVVLSIFFTLTGHKN